MAGKSSSKTRLATVRNALAPMEQKEMAALLGVSLSNFKIWESGRPMPEKFALKVQLRLGVSAQWLLGIVGDDGEPLNEGGTPWQNDEVASTQSQKVRTARLGQLLPALVAQLRTAAFLAARRGEHEAFTAEVSAFLGEQIRRHAQAGDFDAERARRAFFEMMAGAQVAARDEGKKTAQARLDDYAAHLIETADTCPLGKRVAIVITKSSGEKKTVRLSPADARSLATRGWLPYPGPEGGRINLAASQSGVGLVHRPADSIGSDSTATAPSVKPARKTTGRRKAS